jgi:hypothetical protein
VVKVPEEGRKDKQDTMIELLEELVKWTRVTSIPYVKKLLLEILASPEEKIAYQSSDGKKSSKEVANLANVSYATVTLWWKRWTKAGIAEAVSVRGGKRARRLFLLDDFGIEVPVIKVTAAEEGNGGEEET